MNTFNIILQAAAPEGGWEPFLLLTGGLILITYLFVFRPQMKKAKETRQFKEGIEKGQSVVTIGGIHGKILEVNETTILLSVGGNKMKIEKAAISSTSQVSEQEIQQKA